MQEEYRSLVMTPRDAEKIVKAMRVGGNKAIPLGRLSISAPLLDLINSCDTLKSTSPSTEALTQCMSDDVLKEAYLLLINSVSGLSATCRLKSRHVCIITAQQG